MAALRFVVLALWAVAAAAATAKSKMSPAGATTPSAGLGSQDSLPAGLPPGPAPAPAPSPTAAPSGLGLPALHRALFVVAGLAGLGLLYYVGGRALRTRKPPRKKYGLLSNSDDHMEMGSLESDEDTVFETRNLRR